MRAHLGLHFGHLPMEASDLGVEPVLSVRQVRTHTGDFLRHPPFDTLDLHDRLAFTHSALDVALSSIQAPRWSLERVVDDGVIV